MLSPLPVLLALGTLSRFAAADTLTTYREPGCDGAIAYKFPNLPELTCAVSWDASRMNISEAIARGLTVVSAAKFTTQNFKEKVLYGWSQGILANENGPLQCGTIVANETLHGPKTCMKTQDPRPADVAPFTGFSYTRPSKDKKGKGKGKGKKDKEDSVDKEYKEENEKVEKRDTEPKCVGVQFARAVVVHGKAYDTKVMNNEAYATLHQSIKKWHDGGKNGKVKIPQHLEEFVNAALAVDDI